MGWLVNREQRKSHPADYALGEPLPSVEGLPVLDDTVDTVDTTRVLDFSFENRGVDTLTPLTAGDTSPPPTVEHMDSVAGLPPDPPMHPTGPCSSCGSGSYWLRDEWTNPTWVCSRCHPKPEGAA